MTERSLYVDIQVTVIIPTYNRSHVLWRAVESVLNQTFRNIEIIVVDDGSTDNTQALLDRCEDRRLRCIRFESNRGQNAALNAGVRESRGEYCAFLDSDDEWYPMFLERVLEKFVLNDRVSCVYTWANFCNAATGKCEVARPFAIEGVIYPQALAQGYVSHMITLVVRRSVLLNVGLFDEEFEVCQDDDICIRLAAVAKFALIPEPLATIHQDAGNQATSSCKKYSEGAWRLVNKFATEIAIHCGDMVLSRHFEKCGDLFWRADNREMALVAYRRANHLHRRLVLGLKQWSLRLGLEHGLAIRLKRIGTAFYRGS